MAPTTNDRAGWFGTRRWLDQARLPLRLGTAIRRVLAAFANARPAAAIDAAQSVLRGGALPPLVAQAAGVTGATGAVGTAGADKRASEATAGRFIASRFGARNGRNYMLYVPSKREWHAPLLVMLHGCRQDAKDFAIGTRMNEIAEEHGVVVLYPEQSGAANPMRCWNWYDTSAAQGGRSEAALIAAMTEQIVRRRRIDRSRIYVAGLSAGGSMAGVLGRDYPHLFAAVGVHSGVRAGAARSLRGALFEMLRGPRSPIVAVGPESDNDPPIATIVFHGDHDRTVHPSNGEAIHAAVSDEAEIPSGAWVERVALSDERARAFTRSVRLRSDGSTQHELWMIHGAGHAWAGGSPDGSFTDADGPNAAREMLRFFLQHRLDARQQRRPSRAGSIRLPALQAMLRERWRRLQPRR